MKRFVVTVLSLFCILSVDNVSASNKIYTLETVIETLQKPWSMAFLPSSEILITELSGNIRILSANSILSSPLSGVPEPFVKGQGGLSDIILHPDFLENKLVYISFSLATDNGSTLRVIKATLEGKALKNIVNIFTARAERKAAAHYGARLLFLQDKTLLISSGDGANHREEAQSLKTHFGKIIRINDDGSIPDSNPFVGNPNALPEIWSYGHRNPQGLVLINQNTVMSHEHGPKGGDELNRIVPGLNYGWPAITYGIDYNGSIISPFKEKAGMEKPLHYWIPSIAPADMSLYTGDVFPEWRGNLLISAMSPGDVRRIVLKNNKFESEHVMFKELNSRIRSIKVSPSGDIFLLTDGTRSEDGIGQLIKVVRK
jgi:glucose/arabinose dehydrogenase